MARDLTTGSLRGHVLALAPSAAMTQLLLAAFEFIDAFWVGRLEDGSAALAALAIGTYLLWALFSLGHVIEAATLALCARSLGAKDVAGARIAADRGAVFAIFVWLAAAATLIPAAPSIAHLAGLEGATHAMAVEYLVILVGGSMTLFGFAALDAVFRAAGDTRTPMLLLVVCLAFNAVLDPLLMNGGFGIPAMGLAGAAWATVGTRLIAVVIGAVVLYRRGLIGTTPAAVLTRLAPYRRYLRIGVPAGSTGFLYCATFMALARLLAPWGEDAVAAMAVGQKIESASWSVMFALGTVAGAVVGQNLGARSPERAREGAGVALRWAVSAGVVFGALFFLARDPLIGLLAPGEPGVLVHGRAYLLAVGLAQVFMAVELVVQQALTGSGDTVPPMIIIVTLTAARIPLAWGLSVFLDLGPAGIFWAMSITTVLKAALMWAWYRRGTWIARGLAATGG